MYAQSADRIGKERSMRMRQMKRLLARLKQLMDMTLSNHELLMKLGAARGKYPAAWRLFEVTVEAKATTFSYRLRRDKLRPVPAAASPATSPVSPVPPVA